MAVESPPGVRAAVVAMKRGNARGAKGPQEGGYVSDRAGQTQPAAVPSVATQAGDVRARWAWIEPALWSERMLKALEEGVKGGKWYSLMAAIINAGPMLSSPIWDCSRWPQPGSWRFNPLGGEPPTGEPDAGDPPVRFGGRGSRKALPTPIKRSSFRDFGMG